MKIINIKNIINITNFKTLYDKTFWKNWIGQQHFCDEFLEKTFYNKNYNYLIMLNKDEIIGIFVYEKVLNTNIYKIILIAKQDSSKYKKIGKQFIRFMELKYKNNILILIDDSWIENYYEKLGFKLTSNKYYSHLLESKTNKKIYKKNI